ncbi:MAG: DNA-deoxyinosine glycosylase [Lachnospiraceae bacterium]|nr:DNA-deoxyinosine glycosylase [Lachnospiraceae bacterium]
MEYQKLSHTFEPVWNENSTVLILGSFPSVKSREEGFYYGHPRNRFWKVLAAVKGEDEPTSIDGKKEFLLRNRIAVWDVIASCEIKGSSDSSIRNVIVNDFSEILEKSKVSRIFANGKTAQRLYKKYVLPDTGMPITALPSTSPANAAFSLEKLIDCYRRELR